MKQFGCQVVGCSMPAMQRRERHGHQELIAASTGQQASWSKTHIPCISWTDTVTHVASNVH